MDMVRPRRDAHWSLGGKGAGSRGHGFFLESPAKSKGEVRPLIQEACAFKVGGNYWKNELRSKAFHHTPGKHERIMYRLDFVHIVQACPHLLHRSIPC